MKSGGSTDVNSTLVLANKVLDGLAWDMIAAGIVDPKGQDFEKLRIKCGKYVLEHPDLLKGALVDHTFTLTREARRFAGRDMPELSILLHATACEHWINDVVSVFCRRKKVAEMDRTQILRDAPYRAKCTWVLKLLGAPPIPERHVGKLTHLMDLRNEFVHYKWKGSGDERDDNKMKQCLDGLRPTLSYLARYRRRVVLRNVKLRRRKGPTLPRSSPRSAS
jgi:hypothetical protein